MKVVDNCRIRQLREINKLTQLEMAEMLGINRVSYNHIETGKTTPRVNTVFKIAELFSTDIDYFFIK